LSRGLSWTWLLLTACAVEPEPTLPTCAEAMADVPPLTGWESLTPLIEQVRADRYPELAGVPIELGMLESETDFFVANLVLSTATNPPLEREYLVLANPALLADPPPPSALYAILVHELAHIRDYTEKDTAELVSFGLWYAQGDTAAYERATDEVALKLGCGEGLKAYREWLYERLDAEAVEAKRETYYTPEEIEAWMAANP
jgi:hypothetical protein